MRWIHLFISLFTSTFSIAESHFAPHAMVVSEQRDATLAGLSILKAGGNAIDAAVAVGYALAVVNPCCGNIGGGGFMTIHLNNGKNIFINFREKAPLKATATMFQDANGNLIPNKSTKGFLAVGVPGTVMGLDTALKLYGTMTRQQVMKPAINLARNGYRVTAFDAKWFAEYVDDFRKSAPVAAIFLKNGEPYREGELLKQSDLAHSLELVATKGTDAFYKGSIAKDIVAASNRHGGILSLEDFADYNVEILKPIQCDYRGYNVISAPPPSSGGITLCEMLAILNNFPMNDFGFHSVRASHIIIEAMRYAFNDRNADLGDPDFVKNPTDHLLSKNYAREISDKIKNEPYAAQSVKQVAQPKLSDTTHYSVVDAKGNAVSVTYTINGFFGAKVIADHTGFFLNDEMDDFAAKPGEQNYFGLVQGNANAIAPGKRPLSSMTPTILLRNGKLFMVVGSPGGPRIITSVLLTILNVIDNGMSIQQAVNAPRFHFQGLPNVVFAEPFAFTTFTQAALRYLGYDIVQQSTWSAVEAILVNPETGNLDGANDDVRRPAGAAIGY